MTMRTYLVTVELTALFEVEASSEEEARQVVPPVNTMTFVYDAEYIGYDVLSVVLLDDDPDEADEQWAAYLALDYEDKGTVVEWDAGDADDDDDDFDLEETEEVDEDGLAIEYEAEEDDWDDDDDDDFDLGFALHGED